MKISIEHSSSLLLEEENIINYGGTSKIYRKPNDTYCYKKIKDEIKIGQRNNIFHNLIELVNTNLPNFLILPETFYLDEAGVLTAEKIRYIEGISSINECRRYYYDSRYLKIINSLINFGLHLTQLEYIVADLKIANIIWDSSFNCFGIDNDFTFYKKVPDYMQDYLKTRLNVEYKRIFGELNLNYNIYCLYLIIARLLLTPEEYIYVTSIKQNKSNIKTNKSQIALNYFIQKNRGIPQNFKMELRNLFSGDREIVFDKNIKEDLTLFLSKRRKNK